MGSVVLVADETVAAAREVVYSLFGSRQGAGWIFAADCDALAVGSVVTLQLPVGGGQAAVDVLGRVASLVPPRQIVIAFDQPWRGRAPGLPRTQGSRVDQGKRPRRGR